MYNNNTQQNCWKETNMISRNKRVNTFLLVQTVTD